MSLQPHQLCTFLCDFCQSNMWEMVSKWSLICIFLMSEICISWYLKIISFCMNHYFLAHFSVGFLVFFIQKRTLCLGYLLLCVACESVSSSVVSNSLPPHGLSMGFTRQEYWSGLPSLLQGIFLKQGSNLGLLNCRQVLYHLSYQGSPRFMIKSICCCC